MIFTDLPTALCSHFFITFSHDFLIKLSDKNWSSVDFGTVFVKLANEKQWVAVVVAVVQPENVIS